MSQVVLREYQRLSRMIVASDTFQPSVLDSGLIWKYRYVAYLDTSHFTFKSTFLNMILLQFQLFIAILFLYSLMLESLFILLEV